MVPLPVLRGLLAGAAATAASGASHCWGPACEAVALDGDAGGSVSLLQHRGVEAAAHRTPAVEPMDPQIQRERLQKALPIAWFHVPKCGSSLNNFLIHLPGVCPGVPGDLNISTETFGERHNAAFKDAYRPLDADGACPGGFSHWGNHDGADPEWDSMYNGHAFGMFRQPEQRILSGYNYGQHAWPLLVPASDELEYAHRLQGCAVRMLAHGGIFREETCGGRYTGMPTDADVKLAIDRLQKGFAFVGITDQWPLSMCLGHRKFGGQCRLSDFIDGRVTSEGKPTVEVATTAHLYDTSPLKGFQDPYDGALYEAALKIFDDDCRRFNVTVEACQPCFAEAGVEVTLGGAGALL